MTTLHDFCESIISGTGGLHSYERHEVAFIPDDRRDMAVANWVIRCLANPGCEGSEFVLERIIAKRESLSEALAK